MSKPLTLTWSALLAALRKTPERLRELTTALKADGPIGSDAQSRREATDQKSTFASSGAWSASQIIGHLCAIESPYRARLVRIAWEDNPFVTAIGPITGDYDPATPVDILLNTFGRLRGDTVRFLQGLPVDARARPAAHAELGPITLRSQAEALLAHDEVHLKQITELSGK